MLNIERILEQNQKKIASAFENAEENWILLKMHILQGWKKLAKTELKKEKNGLEILARILKAKDLDNRQAFFKRAKLSKQYEAHLALLESRFGMPAGKLQPKLYGRFTLDEKQKLCHEPESVFLGLQGLRKNHSCLLLHLIDRRMVQKGLKVFFDRVIDYIRVKEFAESLDIIWHRIKARKAIDSMKYTWFSRINLNLNPITNRLVASELDQITKPSRCEDFDNFIYHREQHSKGNCHLAGLRRLKFLAEKRMFTSFEAILAAGKN